MKNLILRFVCETGGQDLVEYALLAAFLGLATIASMTALTLSFATEFNNISVAFGGGS